VSAAEIDHPYPPTKVMWSPENFGVSVEHIATTADYLRIWDLSETGLSLNAVLSNVCTVTLTCRM
jgi:WD repeat-containing protein 68